ncbi:MAG: pantoate--beta-alanine ligase [Acidimicrobiales bacterium]
MIVTDQPEELRHLLDEARHAGKRVGLHPTMGALHGGHRSNVRQMAAECDTAAVSIFVNPLQFGPSEDFDAYPRSLEADLAQAEEAGAHIVLVPSNRAMLGCDPVVSVHVGRLSEVLEGPRRPGHIDGVATVVTKLLSVAGPCWAYFGEKDFQQLVVVRRLVSELLLPAVVVGCPTVREPDGLALSRRNASLSDDERRAAPALYWSLLAGKRLVEEQSARGPEQVRAAMLAAAAREALLELDYAEVVGPETLRTPPAITGEVRLLAAGRVGRTRLIDNVVASPGEA